jgi:hypothetical protein
LTDVAEGRPEVSDLSLSPLLTNHCAGTCGEGGVVSGGRTWGK